MSLIVPFPFDVVVEIRRMLLAGFPHKAGFKSGAAQNQEGK